MNRSLGFKSVTLLGIAFALWVALQMLSGLVYERKATFNEAAAEMTKGFARPQVLATPLMVRECRSKNEGSFFEQAQADLTQMNVGADIEPRTRGGIYAINTYQLKTKLNAHWNKPSFGTSLLEEPSETKQGERRCGAPQIFIAVEDLRGLRDVQVLINDHAVAFKVGTPMTTSRSGPDRGILIASREFEHHLQSKDGLQLQVSFTLLGQQQLTIVPNAEMTQLAMTANWAHPSFKGVLPNKPKINSKTFSADWSVPKSEQVQNIEVGFIDPVNLYVQTDRAIKYGLLFVVFTFLAVGMFELTKNLRVHPAQYLLVGCAVSIFLALGES